MKSRNVVIVAIVLIVAISTISAMATRKVPEPHTSYVAPSGITAVNSGLVAEEKTGTKPKVVRTECTVVLVSNPNAAIPQYRLSIKTEVGSGAQDDLQTKIETQPLTAREAFEGCAKFYLGLSVNVP